MWNRVVLLIAGLAFGWNVVNYLSVPRQRVREQAVRLALALGAAALLLIWLVIDVGLAALLPGMLAFALAAMVAYAGRARDLSSRDDPWPRGRPEWPTQIDPRVAVLLLADPEPPTYEAPELWALDLRRRAERGEPVRGWLVRPWVLARVRAAYDDTRPEDTLEAWMEGLAARLQADLGEGYLVTRAPWYGRPTPASSLARRAEEGLRRVVLARVGDAGNGGAHEIREQVNLSRVREVGVAVAIADTSDALPWLAVQARERLQRLMRGEALPAARQPADHEVADLAATVRAAASQTGAGADPSDGGQGQRGGVG